jgi:hypothetical protein
MFCLFTTLAGCTGFVAELVGIITINSPLDINTDNKKLVIPSGEHNMSVNFEDGIMGLYDPKLILKSNNTDYTIHIPRQAFNSEKNTIRANAAELKQPFSIDGKKEKVKLQENVIEENMTCSFCGYCLQLVSSSDSKGNTSSSMQYTSSCLCSGTRDALINRYTFEDRYTLNFLKRDDQQVARFVGKGKSYIEKKVNRYLNECR